MNKVTDIFYHALKKGTLNHLSLVIFPTNVPLKLGVNIRKTTDIHLNGVMVPAYKMFSENKGCFFILYLLLEISSALQGVGKMWRNWVHIIFWTMFIFLPKASSI